MVQSEVAWEIEVRRPAVQIARTILPELAEFSWCITVFFLAIASLTLGTLPMATTGNVFSILLVAYCE